MIDNMPFMDKRTMICGLDVYHETEEGQPVSAVGFVASYNKTCTKYWPSSNLTAKAGDEIAHNLKKIVLDALNHFKEANGSYPERLILYRDAVYNAKLGVLQ